MWSMGQRKPTAPEATTGPPCPPAGTASMGLAQSQPLGGRLLAETQGTCRSLRPWAASRMRGGGVDKQEGLSTYSVNAVIPSLSIRPHSRVEVPPNPSSAPQGFGNLGSRWEGGLQTPGRAADPGLSWEIPTWGQKHA